MAVDLSKLKKHKIYQADWGKQIAPVINKQEENAIIPGPVNSNQASKSILNGNMGSVQDFNNNRMLAPVNKSLIKSKNTFELTNEQLEQLSQMDKKESSRMIGSLPVSENKKGNLNTQVDSVRRSNQNIEKANEINQDILNGKYGSAIGHVLSGVPNEAMNHVVNTGTMMASLNPQTKNSENLVNAAKSLTNGYRERNSMIDNNIIKTAGNVSGAIGNMAPSIATSILTGGGGIASNAVQGIGVMSSEYLNTLNENQDNKLKAFFTGLAKGGVSMATERLTGGNVISKGSIDDIVKNKLAQSTLSNGKKWLASKAYEFGGEIAEENLENIAGYLIDYAINQKGTTLQDVIDDAKQTSTDAFWTTLTLNALGLGGNTYKEVKQQEFNNTNNIKLADQTKLQGEIQEKLLNQNKREEKQIANMLANKYGSKTENNNIAIKNQQGQVSNLFIDENTSSNELQREWKRNEQLNNRMENISSEILNNRLNGEYVNEFNGYTQKEMQNIKSDKIKIAESKQDISNFVQQSKSIPNNFKMYLGKVKQDIANVIKSRLGINVDNYNISLSADSIRHAIKQHSNAEIENARGQVALTTEDFQNIPDIINNPDNIELSGKSKQGKDSIKFEKNIDGNNVVITYTSDKHKNLELQTMYKFKNDKKIDSVTASNAEALNTTSETNSDTNLINTIIPQNENKMQVLNEKNNLANNQEMGYNSLESESGINEQIQQGRILESNGELSRIYEKTPQQKEYSRTEYEQWEESIIPTEESRITKTERQIRDSVKGQYQKDIVFFDGNEDDLYAGGASYQNKNKIHIDRKQADTFGLNKMVYHEVLESDILHNRDLYNDLVEPAIQKIMDDPNFEKQKLEFWKNETSNVPSDLLIAKDILCDRFSELKTNEKLDYKNVLSQESNMTIDYALDNFHQQLYGKEIKNLNESSFSLPPDETKNILPIGENVKGAKTSNRQEAPTDSSIYQDENLRAFKIATENIGNDLTETQINKLAETDELPDTMQYIADKRTKPKTSFRELRDSFQQKFVNRGHYIDKLANKTGNKELTHKYDRTMNAFNEAQYSIGEEQVNSKGEVVGESLKQIFEGSEKASLANEFNDYLLNKHNIARSAVGKGIYGDNVSAPQSSRKVADYEARYPSFKEWGQKVSKYNENNLQDMVDTGMLSQDTFNRLRSLYGDYIPTYRDIIDEKVIFDDNSVGGNVIGKATKSNQKILAPKEAMAEQTLAIKKAIRMNELGVELYKTLGQDSKVFDGIDFDPGAIQSLAGGVIEKAQDGTNTFVIFQDGQMTQFKISDELYTAFSKDTLQARIDNSNLAKAVLTPVEKLSKAQRDLLTTYSIGFSFNNPIKDIQDAVFNTKYGVPEFAKNYVKSLYQLGTKGEIYKDYIRNGGNSNTYFDYERGILPNRNKIQKVVDRVKGFNEILEQAPRLAEYMTTLENGGTKSEALYNSAEITTNFKRGGEITKVANRYGANFLNASVQGLDKQIRNITGQNGFKGYARLITRATLLGVAPSILNHLILSGSDDKEYYEDLPDYIKDSYYLWPKGKDGEFYRIPKGRVVATLRYNW